MRNRRPTAAAKANNIVSLLQELKRRNVFRVGIAYLMASWLLLQITDILVPILDLPDSAARLVFLLLVIGLIPALIFAWAFELTPEGIKRERDVDRNQSVTSQTGRKLDRIIIAFLMLALGYFAYDKFATPVGGRSAADSPEEKGSDPIKSISVLPFVNMSSDPKQEYFSDGITEEILNRLASIRGLQVAARTSAFSFKGDNQDVREIAQQLGVSNILEGSVRKADGQVRITAQLIRASDGFHLWSESYDRKLENIFAIQDEIASQIAAALEISLGMPGQSSGQAAGQPAKQVNPEVYDLYLRARVLHRQRGEGVSEAIELFQQALAIDPEFAPAWAGLSHSYIVVPNYVPVDNWQRLGDVLEKSMAAAEKALELDPDLPTATHAMGNNLFFRFEWARAQDYYERALQLDPDSADIMEDYASLLLGSWQLDAASKVIERMLALDPQVPIFLQTLTTQHDLEGEFELRDQATQKALEINPDLGFLQAWKLKSLLQNHQYDEARAYAGSMNPAHIDQQAGQALVDWMQHPEQEPGPGVLRALGFITFPAMLAGRYDVWINAVEANGAQWPEWYTDGLNDLLAPTASPETMHCFRADPRTKALLMKLNLPEYWRKVGWPDMCEPIGADDFECH
jgi:adenylate cyclase